MNWLVLGDGFGWRSTSLDIKWIYWAPGQKTQEGSIPWSEVDIKRRIQGSLVRSAEDLHQEVYEKALPLMKTEVKRRTAKN